MNRQAHPLSLTPGFSRVCGAARCSNRFSGFPADSKPLKRLNPIANAITRLKPGANERGTRRLTMGHTEHATTDLTIAAMMSYP